MCWLALGLFGRASLGKQPCARRRSPAHCSCEPAWRTSCDDPSKGVSRRRRDGPANHLCAWHRHWVRMAHARACAHVLVSAQVGQCFRPPRALPVVPRRVRPYPAPLFTQEGHPEEAAALLPRDAAQRQLQPARVCSAGADEDNTGHDRRRRCQHHAGEGLLSGSVQPCNPACALLLEEKSGASASV